MTRTRSKMNDVERLLSETLDTYAADTSVAPDALDRIAAKRVRRRFRPGVLPGLAVAGTTLALGLGAIVLANGGDQVARGPDVLGQPGGPLDQFVQVGSRGVVDCGDALTPDCDRWIDAVGDGAGAFVVVGNRGGTPVVARADGSAWEVVADLPTGGLEAEVRAVATDGERFVAVGARYPKGLVASAVTWSPAAWVSDDGRTWRAADLGPWADAGVMLTGVVRTGAGFQATGLAMGGRADLLDLGLWSSADGSVWDHEGWVGGPLAAPGRQPVTGIEAGPRVLVYAEVLDAVADEGCGARGVAVWVGDEDGVPTVANGDDPRRPSRTSASPGLEGAVLRPCTQATLDGRADGGAGVSSMTDTTLGSSLGVVWGDGGAPTIQLTAWPCCLEEDPGPDLTEATFTLRGDGWAGAQADPVSESQVELVRPAPATDGYRLAIAPVDGSLMSPDQRWSIGHEWGDATGFALGLAVDDGSGWRDAVPAELSPDDRMYRYGALSAGICKGEGWGAGAVTARTWAVSGDRLLIVGRANECLLREPGSTDAEQPWMPAVWIGPLP